MFKKFNSFKENRFIFEGHNAPSEWHAPMVLPKDINVSDSAKELHDVRDFRQNMANDFAQNFIAESEKGEKTFKAMKVLGISQKKLDALWTDDTNPYVTSMIDFLGTGDELLKKDVRGDGFFTFKNKNGKSYERYIPNLNRAFVWKSKIYPELVKIIGTENYDAYKSVIEVAVLKDTPQMGQFLDWICDRRVSDPMFPINMVGLVRTELDKLRRGVSVSQLRSEADRLKQEQRLFSESLKKEKTVYLDPDAMQFEDNEEDIKRKAKYRAREAEKQARYGDIISEKDALFKTRIGAEPLSEEDYRYVNEGLDNLMNDTLGRIESPDVLALHGELMDMISNGQAMAANGSSMSEIKAYFNSMSDLKGRYDKVWTSSDESGLSVLDDLYESKVIAMANRYGLSLVEKGQTEE